LQSYVQCSCELTPALPQVMRALISLDVNPRLHPAAPRGPAPVVHIAYSLSEGLQSLRAWEATWWLRGRNPSDSDIGHPLVNLVGFRPLLPL